MTSNNNVASYHSTSTSSGWDPLLAGSGSGMTTTGYGGGGGGSGGGGLGYHYGSTTAASNIFPVDAGPQYGDDTAIVANVRGNCTAPPSSPLARGHRHRHHRARSEVSHASFASFASFDCSVEPVMTDMTKSVMFNGVTPMGVVKLQLPKDNFRLLIDRDLGEFRKVASSTRCIVVCEVRCGSCVSSCVYHAV